MLQDLEQAKRDLDALGLKGRRFVLASRRLSAEERHGLYLGVQMRNQIILLEPREGGHPTISGILICSRMRSA